MRRLENEERMLDNALAELCQEQLDVEPSTIPARTVTGSVTPSREPTLPPLVAEKSILVMDWNGG